MFLEISQSLTKGRNKPFFYQKMSGYAFAPHHQRFLPLLKKQFISFKSNLFHFGNQAIEFFHINNRRSGKGNARQQF